LREKIQQTLITNTQIEYKLKDKIQNKQYFCDKPYLITLYLNLSIFSKNGEYHSDNAKFLGGVNNFLMKY